MAGGEEGTDIGDDDTGFEGVTVGCCELLKFSLDETVRIVIRSTESFIRRNPSPIRHLPYQKLEESLLSLLLIFFVGLALSWLW
jgi:hypothetical protein